jgi:sec-independent protein translocase protein TatA
MLPILATLSEWHIILALIIVFLLFGGKKLPELARGIGEAMKEFKKSQRDVAADDAHRTAAAPPVQPTPTATPPATPVAPSKPTEQKQG